jgi:sRNA-binding carbon storage regulator CsrA
MLELTLKPNESVAVGSSSGFELVLKIKVLEIRGGAVKLGFESDAIVPVQRWEVWERLLGLSEDNEMEEDSTARVM